MPGSDEPTVWRAWTHGAAGGLEWWAGNPPGADSFYALELDFGRAVGDRAAIADALFNLCHTKFMDAAEHDRIDRMQAEALQLYRDIGDERGVARVAFISGYPLLALGKVDEAKVHVTWPSPNSSDSTTRTTWLWRPVRSAALRSSLAITRWRSATASAAFAHQPRWVTSPRSRSASVRLR